MGNKPPKKFNSSLDEISKNIKNNQNINNNNENQGNSLIGKMPNNNPSNIKQIKANLISSNVNKPDEQMLPQEDGIKIIKVSNENELREEYKIEINKYHHKINNRKVKIPQKLKNYITTSKYTWYNFVPKILYQQFTKMSNIYFVIIAILQCFPEISNADGKPIILMPLSVVIIVNSVKDFYEDWKRKKSDDEENNRKVEVYDLDQEKFVIKKWKDVFVGNILKVKRGEYFPADCVLISSTDRKTHGCYIETKNLDGETNLKLKKSVIKFVNRCKQLNSFQGKFITQLPNEYIYQFSGVFEFDYNDNFHSISNILENNNNTINKEKKSHLRDLISNDIEGNIDNIENNDKINSNKENNNEEKLDDDFVEEKINNEKKGDDNNINSIRKKTINGKEKIKDKKETFNLETDMDDNLSEHTYYTRRKNTEDDISMSTLSHFPEDKTVIVDNNSFLLRGCSLRQTESVLCFVVYAGKNTKIMQNSPGARAKTSSIEKRMNQQIKYIFSFQILLGLAASLFSFIQIISLGKDPAPYLYLDKEDRPFNFEEYSIKFKKILSHENLKKIFGKNNESVFSMLKLFFNEISPLFEIDIIVFLLVKLGTWCVLLNNLVPISLLMTLELVKYFQGFFISWDIDIYDKRQKVTTKVQTSTLNEELGQIKYIFSDKTGTLTKNFMKFKRVSIGLKQYNENKNNSNNNIDEDYENNILGDNDIKNNINFISNEKLNNKNDIESEKDIKIKNKQKYRDEYGRIRHVSFDNDEELIKDLNVMKFLNKDKEIQKDENNIDINNKEENIKNENDINNGDLVKEEKNSLEDEMRKSLIEDIKDQEDEISKKEEEDNNIINEKDELLGNKNNDKINKNSNIKQKEIADLFMTALSTCHSAVIEEKEFNSKKKLIYQASSPDEIAILNFARKYKYIFLGRKDDNKIIIKKPINSTTLSEITYRIPFQFEYSSERKSMSVVLQGIKNPEEIYLFMKGADSVILPKLDKDNIINKSVMNNLKNALDLYSKEGLRILAVAYKKLTIEEMQEYNKEFFKASKSTYSKKEKIEELAKKVEKNLIFLGVTAIEDELQDNVNETLKDFSDAGIKLWVLTGDKKDTAKSIAYSCGLFDDEKFNIFEIGEGLNKIQLEARLNELVEQFNNIVDKMDDNKSKPIKVLYSSKIDLTNSVNNVKINNNNALEINDNNNINNNINNFDGDINDKIKNNENEIKNDEKDIKIEVNQNQEKKDTKNNNPINNINNNEKKEEDLIDNELNTQDDNKIKKGNEEISTKEDISNNPNSQNNYIKKNENKENNINKNDENIKQRFALVISSEELNILSLNYELEILFYEISSRCNSVLCCRVSPIQKAKMVHLIQRFTKLQQKKGSNYYKYISQNENNQDMEDKKESKNKTMSPLKDSVITLAIGDGANDVNMITSAHVGVGIIGVEGKQAARASDYAIGQFKFLKKILFYHGHESLRRNAFIIYYNFYKNFLFVMPQFYVGFFSLFSGQSIYDPWLYQLFNIVFSVFPILWFGIYDSERTTTVSMNNAKYYSSINNKLYDNWNFWKWIFDGIMQGLAVFIFVFFSNNTYSNNNSGEIQDFKSMGMMTYSLVVIIVNLKVFQMTSVHGIVSIFFLIFSIASYYALTLLMANEPSMFYFGVFWKVLKNIRYFFVIGCLCLGLTMISWGFLYLKKLFQKYETKTKYNKIMYQYYKNKEESKKKKKNKKKINKEDKKNIKKELIKEENPTN